MSDPFASFARGLDSPYTQALALTAAMGEFAPTRAVFINGAGILSAVLADDSDASTFYFDSSKRGIYHFRVKQLLSFTDSNGVSLNFSSDHVPPIVGLW